MPNIYPGPMGSQMPVRDASGKRLPLDVIRAYVMLTVERARQSHWSTYQVQRDGWGYPWCEIAPLFDGAPDNVELPVC